MAPQASACALMGALLATAVAMSANRAETSDDAYSSVSRLRSRRQAVASLDSAREEQVVAVAFLQQRVRLLTKPGADVDAATRTLQSLDTNHNGKLDSSEIAMFAQTQGLDAASATNELSALDSDGDGALTAQELAGMFSSADTASEAVPQVPLVQQPRQTSQLAVPQVPVVLQAPQTAQLAVQQVSQLAATAPAAATATIASGVDASVAEVLASTMGASVGASQGEVGTFDAASAESAAKTFEQQLALESKEQAEAQDLERRGAELRANSTALSRRMVQNALAAGTAAATQKAKEVLDTMHRLEVEETKEEVQAASLRAKAAAELREARELMSVADSALKEIAPVAA